MHHTLLPALTALMLLSFASESWAVALRCDGKIIDAGTPRLEVDEKCGNPSLVHAQITSYVHKQGGTIVRESFENKKYMVFDQGPRAGLYVVALNRGKVVEAQSVPFKGTGSHAPHKNCFEVDSLLQIGLENYLVEYLCGRPDSIELVRKDYLPIRDGVSKTVHTERWSYLRDGKRYSIEISDNRLSELGR